ncbi:MAG: IclR family transcriptional regulator [Peptococcales bacterium]|jgi:IclR family KDG regulon transcriptional repressor
MKEHIQSILKALDILELLNESENEMGVNEIGKQALLPATTVHRILHTLESRGYVFQNQSTSKFKVGPKFLDYFDKQSNNFGLKEIAYPFMEQLAQFTKENIALGILDKNETLHLVRIESSEALKADIKDFRLPAYCTAIGKYLLAHLTEDSLEKLLTDTFPRLTPNTITNLSDLKKELVNIKEKRYSIDNEEIFEGIRCMATGIWDCNKNVIAGISITAPAFRFPDSKIPIYEELLKETASKISKQIQFNKHIINFLK